MWLGLVFSSIYHVKAPPKQEHKEQMRSILNPVIITRVQPQTSRNILNYIVHYYKGDKNVLENSYIYCVDLPLNSHN